VDDLQIRAHKMILSSCSPLFKNILIKNPHKNPLIYLKDIRYRELDMVMKFIYLGQCDVGEWELEHFLAVGKELQINGLIEDMNLKYIKEYMVGNDIDSNESQEPT
jgi:hypothetical protein